MSGYTSYLSNLLTHTTSRYNSLRKILLSNEDDGDTEDDSHISRVLRAYYKEKGQPLPPWLPPDPNDRRAITPQIDSQTSGGYFGIRNPYASNVQQQSTLPSNRGSLNDLWDAPAATPQQPTSLRAGRRAPGTRAESTQSNLAVLQARPLPSQRAGSYQTAQSSQPAQDAFKTGGFAADPTPSPSVSGGTAQDRLKAKLWGRGGNTSSSGLSTSSNSNVYDQQAASNPYDTGGSSNYSGGGTSRRYGRIG